MSSWPAAASSSAALSAAARTLAASSAPRALAPREPRVELAVGELGHRAQARAVDAQLGRPCRSARGSRARARGRPRARARAAAQAALERGGEHLRVARDKLGERRRRDDAEALGEERELRLEVRLDAQAERLRHRRDDVRELRGRELEPRLEVRELRVERRYREREHRRVAEHDLRDERARVRARARPRARGPAARAPPAAPAAGARAGAGAASRG